MMLIGSGHPTLGAAFVMRGRGVSQITGGFASAQQVLPTDPQGTMTLTLTNLVVGSRYRVEDATTGALVADGTAAAATVPLAIEYYLPSKTVRIKVRKGTAAPKYQPFDTQAVIGSLSQSIFVAQVADPIA